MNLKVSLLALVLSLLFGVLLIPPFELVGAALSMFIYGLASAICYNVYLLRRKMQPYSPKLWVEFVWILALIGLYIFVNTDGVHLEMWHKIAIYVVTMLILGAQYLFYKRKF